MLGFSVYLSESVKGQEGYIRKMKDHGFTSIFTSLHIPEDDPGKYKDELAELGGIANEIGMELMADISPKSLHHLGFTWETADGLLSWGLTGLRIDYGVEDELIAELSQKMRVALNASTLTAQSLENMKRLGLKVAAAEAWHNFYPRPETGLARDFFHEQNKLITEAGLTVMAFVPGDEKRRGPLYQGLPTLEDHRFASPFAAYVDLKEQEGVGKILVGDVELGEDSLRQFTAYSDGVILLRAKAHCGDEGLLRSVASIQTNRTDVARDVIRSMESRLYATIGTGGISPENTVERPAGSITVDNERYDRYQGEIQITKRDLPVDAKVNVIGRIIEEDRLLLPFIKGGKRFRIEWVQ
ncbi:DUF871 domain-containing protein [Mesobacillus zeae]|uniref:DUF871 domain-containing protein n=1 Tax=Mesobacillus zeae TaxID=1917180 RepID=A0A398AYW8_9BACI|nr:MupG family TIM beta-alpha barrel fold protein [Mesobacillus zeae]RID82691.1 DUF871 domain-containing protein [Mesobacillus zeae]